MLVNRKSKDRVILELSNQEAEIVAAWIQFGVNNSQLPDPELPRRFMNYANDIIGVVQGNLSWEIDTANVDKYKTQDDQVDENEGGSLVE